MVNKKTLKKKKRYPELTALKGIMLEKKITYAKMAQMLGVGITTLSDKINGFYSFDIEEVNKILNILDIGPNEIAKYFFPKMLRNVS